MLICFGQRISTTSLLTPRSEREIGARAVGSVANETLPAGSSLQLELGNQHDYVCSHNHREVRKLDTEADNERQSTSTPAHRFLSTISLHATLC